MEFRTMNIEADRETLLTFNRSLTIDAIGKEWGDFDENSFIERLRTGVERFPNGYVLVLIDNQPVGHMELQVKSYEERPIGYVSTIYLHPDYRGQGVSQEMFAYAERFFREQSVDEYHLRVDVRNARALRFYEKAGLSSLCKEPNTMGHLCYRLWKQLEVVGNETDESRTPKNDTQGT